MDTGLTDKVEDEWKNACLPQQRIARLWIGGTRLYVLEEYKPYAANAVGTTEPTQEPSTEEETVPTTRNLIHEHMLVTLPRFKEGSHSALRQLEECKA
eukprot:4803374-Amphidinium_carterae.1